MALLLNELCREAEGIVDEIHKMLPPSPETICRGSNAVAVGNDGWDYCYFNWTG